MHLFIVSEKTLPVHLEHGFAGVAKPESCSWSHVTIPGNAERGLASLYADVCRVHAGDEILFYLETPSHDVGREGGRFLGIFEVTSPRPFYDAGGGHLLGSLGLPLIYRHLMRPKEVFRVGVTEWQLMDEMSDFRSIHEIPWTLIYRKMEGRRGCTPLLPHESENIRRTLDLRNAGQRLQPRDIGFDLNSVHLTNYGTTTPYAGHQPAEDIGPRLQYLMGTDRKWELHLQAYLMQELGRNQGLTENLFPGMEITWIGNEVYAGAGRQSIDILVYARNALNEFVHLIELKSSDATGQAADQLNRYIKWVRAHIPGMSVHQIIPTVIAPGATQDFHDNMKTYLLGHGIGLYKVVRVNRDLSLHPKTYDSF